MRVKKGVRNEKVRAREIDGQKDFNNLMAFAVCALHLGFQTTHSRHTIA